MIPMHTRRMTGEEASSNTRPHVSLRLHKSMLERIEKITRHSGMTKSAVIAHLIGVGIGRLERQYEREG